MREADNVGTLVPGKPGYDRVQQLFLDLTGIGGRIAYAWGSLLLTKENW
jgi:hypothetical protein